ncbi:MAG: hypothetical protein ACYCW6_15305, partial [Candidatus Xenobia bacterium]
MISVPDALAALNELDAALSRLAPEESERALLLVVCAAAQVIDGGQAVLCPGGGDPPVGSAQCLDAMRVAAMDFERADGLAARAAQEGHAVLEGKVTCLPIDSLGTLYVVTPHRLRGTALALLQQVTHRAAASLRVRSMHQELLRKEDELQRLHRSALLISSRSNVQTTL